MAQRLPLRLAITCMLIDGKRHLARHECQDSVDEIGINGVLVHHGKPKRWGRFLRTTEIAAHANHQRPDLLGADVLLGVIRYFWHGRL